MADLKEKKWVLIRQLTLSLFSDLCTNLRIFKELTEPVGSKEPALKNTCLKGGN